MRIIIAIGAVNVLLGLFAFLAPLKFYSIASQLFTPEISPPFSFSLVQTAALYLSLPADVLLLNGAAFMLLGLKLERVAELRAFSEEGNSMGKLKAVEVEDGKVKKFELEDDSGSKTFFKKEAIAAVRSALIVRSGAQESAPKSMPRSVVENEFVGKEVYNQFGKYYGKVVSVNLDDSGRVSDFLAVRGSEKRVIKANDVDSNDGVIIVRA